MWRAANHGTPHSAVFDRLAAKLTAHRLSMRRFFVIPLVVLPWTKCNTEQIARKC